MTASAPRDDDASPMSSGAGHAAGPVVAGAASASDPHLTANPTTQPTHPKPRFIELEFITPPASTSQPRPASTSSAAWVVPGQAPPGSPVAWATGAQPAPPTEWPTRESQPPTEPYDPYPVTEPYDPYPTARSHDPYRAAETTPAPVDRPARVVRPEHQHRQPEPFDPYPTAAAPVTPVPAPTPAVDPADELEPEPFIDGAIARFLAAGPRRSSQPLSDVNGVSVTLTVADLGRSLRFYRDTLGLVELDSGPGSAVLATGDARVVLRRDVDMPPVDRRVVHLNLEVPDVYEAYERLRDQGVEFVHRPRTVAQGEQLELCSATFRDPDGHAIALTRWEIRRQA